MTNKQLLIAIGTLTSLILCAAVSHADILDPLHGYCGVGQCADNGTNSPTSNNPPVNFGFAVDPGPASGDLTVDLLVPNNQSHANSYAITGTLSGTATLFSTTAWTSGALDMYLGISASPNNPIGAFLPSTQALDPGATGFLVYQVDLGMTTLQGASNPNVSPLLNISPGIPLASYLVGFLNEGGGNIVATANSGAIFETSAPVSTPEPNSLVLLGTGMIGFAMWARRKVNL
jgi:hypothetical protein